MEIGFLIPFFNGRGGMERIVVSLATGMARRGHRCTLIHPEASRDAYPVPDTLERLRLPGFTRSRAWVESARPFLQNSKFDVLCILSSTFQGRQLYSLCQGLRVPLVWSEHSSPRNIEQERWNRQERLACIAGSDAVHLLCRSFLQSLPPVLQKRATVIPNFPDLKPGRNRPASRRPHRLLTVARLVEPVKQHSLLLHAFAALKEEFPDWEARICGEGPSRSFYEKLITKLGLEGRVHLAGKTEDVAGEYAEADIFVFPSRFEGFGIALAEAQCFGLPGVGFAGCSGVNEIIVHGENGFLAPEMTAESLANQLRVLMRDEALRQRMGVRAQELSRRYDKEHVLDQWENLLKRAANEAGHLAQDRLDSLEDPEIQAALPALCRAADPVPLLTRLRSQTRLRMTHTSTH